MSMKTRFGIKNFRAFDEKGVEVEMAPITILTGCNSSGKSSITKGYVLYNSVLSALKLKDELFKETGGVFDGNTFSSIGHFFNPNARLGKVDFSKPVINTLGNIDMLLNNRSNSDVELSMDLFSYVLNTSVKVVLHISSFETDIARNGHVTAIDFYKANDNTLIGHLDRDSAKWYVKSIEDEFVEQITNISQLEMEAALQEKGMKNKIYGLFLQHVRAKINDQSKSSELFAKYSKSRLLYSSSLLDSVGDCTPENFESAINGLLGDKEVSGVKVSLLIKHIEKGFRESGYNRFIDYYMHLYSLWISGMRTVQEYTLSYWAGVEPEGAVAINDDECRLQFMTKLSRVYSSGYEIVDLIPDLFKEFMSLFVEEITRTVRLDYVSSARATIKRAYPRDITDEFTTLISEYFDARFKASDKKNKKNIPDVYNNSFIDHWLNEFKIGKAFHPTTSEDGSSYIIRIVKNDGTERLLADEGYGVTQFISILLQIEIAALRYKYLTAKFNDDPSQATIIVEEPEIHLHPRYQSLLAEMFLDAYKRYHIHFIIETHSEYIIRRFQTLVADKQLTPSDISISYLADEEHEAAGEPKVKHIEIKEDGFLSDSFGSGFFDEGSKWSKELIDRKFS